VITPYGVGYWLAIAGGVGLVLLFVVAMIGTLVETDRAEQTGQFPFVWWGIASLAGYGLGVVLGMLGV
jgi:hypothetical protein